MQLWGIFIIIFSFSQYNGPGNEWTNSYIERYKYLAIDEMHRSGIPASIIMAQAIVESQSGQSALAISANNHFGIKCKRHWGGETYYHVDDDRDENGQLIESCFRKYQSIEASFIDHSNFLMNRAHYRQLFRYQKTDYRNWAKGLKRAGYATDPKYADKLIRTIEQHQLNELDYYIIKYE